MQTPTADGDARTLEPPALALQLLNDEEAAAMLGISRSYMRKMRVAGTGPRYAAIGGRAIRYRLTDLWAWVDSKTVRSTSETTQRKTAA